MTLTPPSQADVLEMLSAWGQAREAVRAVLLTSSRSTPAAPVDPLSDYDVIYFVTDITPFYADDSWLHDFGPLLVVYRDPLSPWHGFEKFARITQYEQVKIDFTICPVAVLEAIINAAREGGRLEEDLDLGYQVLVDKDGLAAQLPPPTYQAYILAPPGAAAYGEVVELFYHEATYCAKNLWRKDLLPVKYFLDYAMKQSHLRCMLEWRMEIDHGWAVKTGVLGRGLLRRLPSELGDALAATYTGPDLADNWAAFYRTIDLFQRVASEVGEQLGFAFPEDLHRRCLDYFHRVERLPVDA